jgi:hypothetical protein
MKGTTIMLNTITTTVFNTIALVIAAGAAIWLAVTGHALLVEGLMLTMGAILGAVIFGFRLNEDPASDCPSFWAGPIGTMRPSSCAKL